MKVITDPGELAASYGGALVPTMGALHEGHLSLVRLGRLVGDPLVVSIFVNPTQFGRGEDWQRYPRTFDDDVAAAAAAGADVVFAPDVETVYPPGDPVDIPPLPPVATTPGLEDAHRPGHFAGVCQVVARLFDLVRPRRAVFGEKDYQQLLVVQAMARGQGERWPDLEIVGYPTVRAADGLAFSSRNAYLDRDQRRRALGVSRALAAARADDGGVEAAERSMQEMLAAHDLAVDYAVVRDARTLEPAETPGVARALVAARVDDIRLIDNMAVQFGPETRS